MFWLFSAFEQEDSNSDNKKEKGRGKHRLFSFVRPSDTQELDIKDLEAAERDSSYVSDVTVIDNADAAFSDPGMTGAASAAPVMTGAATSGLMPADSSDAGQMDLAERAMLAKTDRREMDKLISDQRPFIRASASRALGRFITESDDEYMTAMEAFYEAVLKYEPERGPFPAFAGLVIKRRILDQYRRQQKFSPEISVDGAIMDSGVDLTDEDGVPDPVAIQVQEQVAAAHREPGREDMRLEIDALQQVLSKYGFGFLEMKESAPASAKTRESCREAACLILREGMMPRIRRERHLPMQEICSKLKISSKKIERHRKYIIAVCEILDGDYPYLSEFLGETRARLRGYGSSERRF